MHICGSSLGEQGDGLPENREGLGKAARKVSGGTGSPPSSLDHPRGNDRGDGCSQGVELPVSGLACLAEDSERIWRVLETGP